MANNATATIVGNLIQDPKTGTTKTGMTVISFTVAVNTALKKEDGNGYESNFYNVSFYGKPAEWVFNTLQKGTMVQVIGDQTLQKYVNKNGEHGQSLNIQASKVTPLARMKQSNHQGSEPEDRPF
jgi:single-strand DNA-binding protein